MSNCTKFKMQRALGIELPGLGKPGALEKRNFPPGQHGQSKTRKKRRDLLRQPSAWATQKKADPSATLGMTR